MFQRVFHLVEQRGQLAAHRVALSFGMRPWRDPQLGILALLAGCRAAAAPCPYKYGNPPLFTLPFCEEAHFYK